MLKNTKNKNCFESHDKPCRFCRILKIPCEAGVIICSRTHKKLHGILQTR